MGTARTRARGHARASTVAAFTALLSLIMLCSFLSAGHCAASSPRAETVPLDTDGRQLEVSQEKSWDFERFDVDIQVNSDSSFTVRETQIVNFMGSFSFLTRDLSTQKASFSGGRTYGRVRVKDVMVYDQNVEPYDEELWSVKSSSGGKTVRIDFSATNEQRAWIVEYRMLGAMIFEPEQDRLYYNALSVDRSVPIKETRVTVTLPQGADMEKVKATYYPIAGVPADLIKTGRDGDTLWWTASGIPAYQTLTIDVAFPKGLVEIPLQFRATTRNVMTGLTIFLALAVLVFMLALWWRKGRDIAKPELDVVRYEPPEDLRPAMVGMLVHGSPSTDDITATIVDLAIRGKYTIFENEGGGGKKFGFRLKDRSDSDLNPYERKVIDGLFESGKDVVEEADLTNKFYKRVNSILEGIRETVLEKKLFDGEPSKVKYKYKKIAMLVAVVPLAITWFLWTRVDLGYFRMLVYGFVASGVIVFVVGRFMPRFTARGSEANSQVLGFKEYIETAERDEMENMTQKNAQAGLPYAMVLGLTRQWADKYADIYTTPPSWYESSAAGVFSSTYFMGSIGSMNSSIQDTITSAPVSAGTSSGTSFGGGGGSFGGGSSGGGFGGGGSGAG